MVACRGLSPGLLGGRRAAEPLLHRVDSAEAAEAQEELPGSCQIGNSAGIIATNISNFPWMLQNRVQCTLKIQGEGAASVAPFYCEPAAARRRRSLIAIPSPSSGTGATAIRANRDVSA